MTKARPFHLRRPTRAVIATIAAIASSLMLGTATAQQGEPNAGPQADVLVDPLFDAPPAVAPPDAQDDNEKAAAADGNQASEEPAAGAADAEDQAVADEAPNANNAADAQAIIEANRELLRAEYTKGVTSERMLKSINQNVDRMSAKEIRARIMRLAKEVDRQQEAEVAADQAEQARQDAEQRRVEQQLLGGGANGVVAVPARVAPRLWQTPPTTIYDNGFPFGYGIGPAFPLDARIYVDRYGYVRRAHPADCTCRTCRPRRRRPRVVVPPPIVENSGEREVWYDGLRTRYEHRQ